MRTKHLLFLVALLVAAVPAAAQQWTIGGGVSMDSADISTPEFVGEEDLLTHQVVGRFTNGALLVEGRYINTSNDDEIEFFNSELELERQSMEVAVGGRFGGMFEVLGGVRLEDFSITDDDFFDTDEDLFASDHTLPFVGVNVQSAPARFGVRGSGRYYIGEAEYDFPLSADDDLSGWTAELAFPIRVGDGSWLLEPGLGAEDFESDSGFYQIDSTKVFFNVGFTIR